MRRILKNSRLVAMCAVVLVVLASCLDAAENSFRVTAPTYATVVGDGTGNYRLYLDQGRGIVIPSEESAPINWGNARRVYIKYDLPVLSELKDNTVFTTIVREAKKIDVVELADVTGLTSLPDTLGTEVLNGFAIQAYWGYITMQAVPGNRHSFSMTCSYDRDCFAVDDSLGCDTLFLNLHYTTRNGEWTMETPQTVCAEIPAFVKERAQSDSVLIAMTGKMRMSIDEQRDTVIAVTRSCKVSRARLVPPTHISY